MSTSNGTIHGSQRLQHGERACIIGAGCSGLAAAKALREHGVPYDHFEMTSEVGGLWRASHERSPVFKNLCLLTSKEHTAFSDHPMPDDVPTYGHHSDMHRYLESYADAFDLTEHISFNTKVARVERADDERWIVTTDDGRSRSYGAVLVCSGHHWNPRRPDFSGSFAGDEMHARDYWSPEPFKGQRVLVVGIGNSGSGIAADLCDHADGVTLSTRSGAWVIPKYILGLPTDRWTGAYQAYLPFKMRSLTFRLMHFLTVGNQEKYGVPTPDHNPLEEHPTLNQKLLPRVREGAVEMKPDVQELDGERVNFEDGTAKGFDQIIYATGYQISFPFLPDAVFEAENNKPRLYQQVIHPKLSNLYFIGLVQPAGAIAPLAERQSKWTAKLLSGKTTLPNRSKMHDQIRKAEEKRQTRYHDSPRHSIEVDFWDYALDVESEMTR